MRALLAIWRECVGLFVDDGRLVACVLLWLAACWILLRPLGWSPILLAVGLAAILAENVLRRAAERS